MERNRFALGIHNSPEIKKEKQKLAECLKASRKKKIFTPLRKKPLWRIYPLHTETLRHMAFSVDTLKGVNYFEKKKVLEKQISFIKNPVLSSLLPNYKMKESTKTFLLAHYYKVQDFLYQNQRLRWVFKKFLNRIRGKHLHSVNTTDPITLLAFKEPVYLNIFYLRSQYIFEADTISRHIHKNLLYHDGQIPYSRIPRNPFTNEILSYLQLLSLIQQCRKYGHTYWSIEAFLEHNLSVEVFSKAYYKPLRLHALRDTMKNPKEIDTIDTLYDFIKDQHNEHNKIFIRSVYLWAIEEAFDEYRIQNWKRYCLQWYETDIMEEDIGSRRRKFDKIVEKTKDLCDYPKELIDKKKSILNK